MIDPYKEPMISQGIKKYNDTNACCVVTFCKVFDTTYDKAFLHLKSHGRQTRKGMFTRDIENMFLSIKKSKVRKGPYTKQNRITLGKFIAKHPEGRFFVLVRGHALCVIDGVLFDHNESTRRQVTSAWRIYLAE